MLPTYQECMLPTLQALADGKPRSAAEVRKFLIKHFAITEEEQRVMIKRVSRLFSNSGWARSYLKAAGLIDVPRRGVYAITKAGKTLLATNPQTVNTKLLLDRYPAFRTWFNRTTKTDGDNNDPLDIQENDLVVDSALNPEQQIAEAYQRIHQTLADELLERILQQTPEFFELLVVRLLVAMGYGGSEDEMAEMVVGKAGDEGIDGIIKEDKLGLDNVYIQAKRWDKTQHIGRPEIQRFVGAMSGQGATKGIFITTAQFTEQARKFRPQNNIKVALIDGTALCRHMIDYNIGVAVQDVYELKRIDSDFFAENENQ